MQSLLVYIFLNLLNLLFALVAHEIHELKILILVNVKLLEDSYYCVQLIKFFVDDLDLLQTYLNLFLAKINIFFIKLFLLLVRIYLAYIFCLL